MKRIFTLLLAGTLFILVSCSKKDNNPMVTNVSGNIPPSVTTLAGSGSSGFANGTKAAAVFDFPTGVAINNLGYLIVSDNVNEAIRLVTPLGVVGTICGTAGQSGYKNTTDSVLFNSPQGVALDAAGNVYIADKNDSVIRVITTASVTSTYAGIKSDATFTTKAFSAPTGLATDAAGNLFVSDIRLNTITKITPKGVITTVAGSGQSGNANGTGTAATFNQPTALVVDGAGNIYVADAVNNEIRLINTQGQVSTFAGSGNVGSSNGKGTAASFNQPSGIAIDSQGNLYVADSGNNLIREIASDGTVTTLAGTGAFGATNGSSPLTSTFSAPTGLAVDSYFNVYVIDTGNNLIRVIHQ
jgi:sugar lactone lactonase YvrE